MLNEEEKKLISEECTRYEKRSAACIEALRVVQKRRGWISDEAVRDIAQFLEMSPADVDGVATFYNHIFRKPVGRHVLFVCDSVSCWVMGCEGVKSRIQERLGIALGETSADGELTVLPIACLGRCESAPVLLLDGEPHSNVDAESLDRVLDSTSARKMK